MCFVTVPVVRALPSAKQSANVRAADKRKDAGASFCRYEFSSSSPVKTVRCFLLFSYYTQTYTGLSMLET